MFRPVSEAPISMERRMKFDKVAWDKSDGLFADWKKRLFNTAVFREIGALVIKHRGGPAEKLFPPRLGAFNVILRMKFLDGGSAITQFPAPGYSVFPEEKVKREVSAMRFIEQHTGIHVPHVVHYGMTKESPMGLGPFIIMEYIENDSDLADALNTPSSSGLRGMSTSIPGRASETGRHCLRAWNCIRG